MKWNLDLARRILLTVESHPDATLEHEPEFPDVEPSAVHYHVTLLRQKGLLDAIDASSMDGEAWIELKLTASGHEYLDEVRGMMDSSTDRQSARFSPSTITSRTREEGMAATIIIN